MELPRHAATATLAGWSAALAAVGLPLLAQTGAARGNDLSSHLAVGSYVWDELTHGRADLWFDQVNLGVPLFVAYPPLPALSIAAVVGPLSPLLDPTTSFRLLLLTLLAVLPVGWYRGARAAGLPRLASLFVALGVLYAHDQADVGLGPEHVVHIGLFAQTCALVLLPWTLSSLWRLVQQPSTRQLARSSLWALLLAATHPIFALLAALACGCFAVQRRTSWPWLFGAAGLVLLILAPWWVVAALHTEWAGGIPWRSPTNDGKTLDMLVRWALGGDLLDHQRFPWLTLAALLGLASARRYRSARWVLAVALLSALLMGGRTQWGPTFAAIPVLGELNAARWTSGLQAAALFSAAAGLDTIVARVATGLGTRASQLCAAALLTIGVTERALWLQPRLAPLPLDSGYSQLIAAAADIDGRYVVDGPLGSGSHLHRDLLPHLSGRPGLMSYATTYHATLSTYFVEYFDHSAEQARLFDVTLHVAREGHGQPPTGPWFGPVEAHDYRLHYLDDPGVFEVIRIPVEWRGNPKALRRRLRRVVGQTWAERNLVALAWDDTTSTPAPGPLTPPDPASRIIDASHAPDTYTAEVQVAGPGEHVLLKVTAFPWWQASVDGAPVSPRMVAPNFMAVPVPEGHHEVTFAFRRPAAQRWGAVWTALGGLLLLVGSLSRDRRPLPGESLALAPSPDRA